MADKAILGIVLFPLIGALVLGFFGRRAGRGAVHAIAVLSVAASFVLALGAFGELLRARLGQGHEAASLSFTAYQWFSFHWGQRQLGVPVRFVMDALSAVMTLVVTGVGLLIHVYSMGYMRDDPSYARFFAYLNLFTASMLILVLGSNLPLMFVGWEGVGVCSYLLIGFWYENASYAAAGRKAFVANRIGDVGVLLGMLLLALITHSFEFAEINALAAQRPSLFTHSFALGPPMFPYWVLPGVSFGTVATLCLFLGCSGKSAQLPLFVWLPDAMAGPTPVSALIHAATMVTSGVYLICRLSPVFALAPVTMAVIAGVGALTALLGASVGLVQNELKKILAYSTVSQLGFMFAAVGCGAFAAGFMHVYTHAFFKACLFLGAGSVMHAVGAHADADIRRLGGLGRRMPLTRASFLVSCWAIAGVPLPLLSSGFLSKDEIFVGVLAAPSYFAAAHVGGWLVPSVFACLVLAAAMTALYMFRLYFLTFSRDYRGGVGAAGGPHESPAVMTVPLVLLGLGAAFAGYVWIGFAHFDPWVRWLAPALGSIAGGHAQHSSHATGLALVCGLGAMALGVSVAASFYYRDSALPSRIAARFGGLHRLLRDAWRVDAFYDASVLAASRLLARMLAGFDKYVVDGLMTGLPTQLVRAVSFLSTRIQTGVVHTYAAFMALGLLALLFHFVVPHADPELVSEPVGMQLQLAASPGLGYEYRWDFDSDGEYDTAWSSDPNVTRVFTDKDVVRFAVVFEGASYGARPRTMILAPGDAVHVRRSGLMRVLTGAQLSVDQLGPGWHQARDERPPRIRADADGLLITPRGARVRKDSVLQAPDSELRVARGQSVLIGFARLSVSGFVRPRVQVRNVFGMQRTQSVGVVVPKVERRITAQVAAAGQP